jgi:hypothetical protein
VRPDAAEVVMGSSRTPWVSPRAMAVSSPSVSDPSPHEPPREDHGTVLSELVTAQLRAARAEVFHAWLKSREKAGRLARDGESELPERRGAA